MSETMRLYSATSLIKLGLGTSEGLVRWRANAVAEAAVDRFKVLAQFLEDGQRQEAIEWLRDSPFRSSKTAAARGTDLHSAAEQLALGGDPQVAPEIEPYLAQYQRFLSDFQPEFLMAEAPVYNPTFGYAGTCDGVMRLHGKSLVFDLKTTAHGPNSGKTRPPFSEVALQLVAYRRAELVGVLSEQRYASGKRYYVFDPRGDHQPMPETEGALCIVISPEDYTVTPVRTDDVVWMAWRHVIECARWQVETSRDVFGPQIKPRGADLAVA